MAKQTTIDESLTSAPGAEANEQNTEGQDLSQIASELVESKDPEWVAQLLASYDALIESNAAVAESNKAVIESNGVLIEAFDSFKELASRNVGNYESITSHLAEDQFDEDADYEVAEGKSFRDPKDFDKKYTEGDDVNHLPTSTLAKLHAQGLITEA